MNKIRFLAYPTLLSIFFSHPFGSAQVIASCDYRARIDRGISSRVSIRVTKDQATGVQRGTVTEDNELQIDTTDVISRSYSGASLNQVLRETDIGVLSKSLRIDLKKMHSATAVFLDEASYKEDRTGATIVTLYDSQGRAVAKVGQAGWSYGHCR